MINSTNRIIKAFKVAIEAVTADVYTFPIKNYPSLYVQIGTVTTTEKGCKDLFGHDCTIDIQIIKEYSGNFGSPLDAETLADSVLASLLPLTTTVLQIDDLNMVYLFLENSFNEQGLFETDRTYRKIMQFRFMVEEIPASTAWILETGFWNDSGVWIDTAFWID